MNDDERRAYATALIKASSEDFELLSIFEMAEELTGHEISDDDARAVDELINAATITVTWGQQ